MCRKQCIPGKAVAEAKGKATGRQRDGYAGLSHLVLKRMTVEVLYTQQQIMGGGGGRRKALQCNMNSISCVYCGLVSQLSQTETSAPGGWDFMR